MEYDKLYKPRLPQNRRFCSSKLKRWKNILIFEFQQIQVAVVTTRWKLNNGLFAGSTRILPSKNDFFMFHPKCFVIKQRIEINVSYLFSRAKYYVYWFLFSWCQKLYRQYIKGRIYSKRQNIFISGWEK